MFHEAVSPEVGRMEQSVGVLSFPCHLAWPETWRESSRTLEFKLIFSI